jgi:hypothetical protein
MSFDIFMQHFKDGKAAEAPRDAILELLRSSQHTEADRFGFYHVALADGLTVEFSAKGLESSGTFSGCAFQVRAFGDRLAEFVYQVACAGKMVIMPATRDAIAILVSAEMKQHLPDDLLANLTPVVIGSSAELKVLLATGFDGWRMYRDQVVR